MVEALLFTGSVKAGVTNPNGLTVTGTFKLLNLAMDYRWIMEICIIMLFSD